MTQKKPIMTFEIEIKQCRNFTWQGTLTAGERTVEFRSELELLLAMNRLMPASDTPTCPWDNAERTQH